jgi:hypothetical protein
MMKKTTSEKEIPQCDQDLIVNYLENSVRNIVPLIEGQFLNEFETTFMVEDTVFSLKLEKKPTPKQFKKKAIIHLSIMVSLTAILLITTQNAISKTPYWFHALFGFMVPGFLFYFIDLFRRWFKIPFLIKYFS